MGVDWKCNKSETEGKSSLVDLTTTVGQDLILEELAYKYVCMLRSESLLKLVPQGFEKRLRLASHILGMDANAEALNSERIQVHRYDLSNVASE